MNLILRLNKAIRNVGRLFWVLLSSFVVICFVILVFYVNEKKSERQHLLTDSDWSLIVRAVSTQDHTIGDIGAPVQIIIYVDYECKYCKDLFGSQIPKLQAAFPGKLVFAFRNFPLASQPGTDVEAQAAECVGKVANENIFWLFANYLFTHPPTHGDTKLLATYASAVGVDAQKYATCIQSGSTIERVKQDRLEASIAGVNTTPSEIFKSKNRAFVVSGDYYSQLYTGVRYMLDMAQ